MRQMRRGSSASPQPASRSHGVALSRHESCGACQARPCRRLSRLPLASQASGRPMPRPLSSIKSGAPCRLSIGRRVEQHGWSTATKTFRLPSSGCSSSGLNLPLSLAWRGRSIYPARANTRPSSFSRSLVAPSGGHFQHQYNFIGGRIVDLSHDALDVGQMKTPYLHEPEYFDVPEVQASLAGCTARAERWADRFVEAQSRTDVVAAA